MTPFGPCSGLTPDFDQGARTTSLLLSWWNSTRPKIAVHKHQTLEREVGVYFSPETSKRSLPHDSRQWLRVMRLIFDAMSRSFRTTGAGVKRLWATSKQLIQHSFCSPPRGVDSLLIDSPHIFQQVHNGSSRAVTEAFGLISKPMALLQPSCTTRTREKTGGQSAAQSDASGDHDHETGSRGGGVDKLSFDARSFDTS